MRALKQNGKKRNVKKIIIPKEEIFEQFFRSSGKGGQNVNKVETKAEVRWRVDDSKIFYFRKKEE